MLLLLLFMLDCLELLLPLRYVELAAVVPAVAAAVDGDVAVKAVALVDLTPRNGLVDL